MIRLFRLFYVVVRLLLGGVLSLVPREVLPLLLKPFGARGAPRDAQCQRVARTLQALGPFYIKFGQFLSTRPDIVGVPFAETLGYFQDQLPPFPAQEAEAIVAASLLRTQGVAFDDVFSPLPPALAAASVAQVHRVRLKHSDEEVALKVLRPGIRAQFSKDLKAMRLGARLGMALVPKLRRLRPDRVVETFQSWTDQELDLRYEAASSERLIEAVGALEGYRVPRIYWDYVSEQCLVSEWIEGDKITDLKTLQQRGVDCTTLAQVMMEGFLRQSLFDGFFHGDVHGGNFLVDREGQIVALDFGIMGHISFKERKFLAEVLWCFINRDYERVAHLHYHIGYVPRQKDPQLFALALRAVGEPIFNKPASDISMANVLQQLFTVTEHFGMKTVPELLLLQKTMVMVEGLCRQLDGSFHMWSTAEPIVQEWVHTHYGLRGGAKQGAELITLLRDDVGDLPALYQRARAFLGEVETSLTASSAHPPSWGTPSYLFVGVAAILGGVIGGLVVGLGGGL